MKANITIMVIFGIIFAAFAAVLSLSKLFTSEQLLFILAAGVIGSYIGNGFCKAIGPRKRRRQGW